MSDEQKRGETGCDFGESIGFAPGNTGWNSAACFCAGQLLHPRLVYLYDDKKFVENKQVEEKK
jgi:hypothetical protein